MSRHEDPPLSLNCCMMQNYQHLGFPGGSHSKESARNTGDLSSAPGWGRSPGEGHGYPLQRIPWTEEPGGLQSTGSQRVWHDWASITFTFRSPIPKVVDVMVDYTFLLLAVTSVNICLSSWTCVSLKLLNYSVTGRSYYHALHHSLHGRVTRLECDLEGLKKSYERTIFWKWPFEMEQLDHL